MLLPRKRRTSHVLIVLTFVACHIEWTTSVYDPVTKIESARLYGNVDSFAYYYVDLLVGSPTPQLTSVIVDTGSNIVGFPCANCNHCGHHVDPPFDFGRSQTATLVGCSSDCNAGCESGKCSYSQTYTEGSSISGFWFQDYVKLGDTAQSNPAVVAQLGCHTDENKLFFTQRANGIVGLAPYEGGRPGILTDLFRDTKHVNSYVFSICLGVWGGILNVGGYNVSYHTGDIQWMPLTLGRYYVVEPTSLELDDQVIAGGQESFGTAFLDSGTTYTYFPLVTYTKLDAAIQTYCASHGGCGATYSHGCWSLAVGHMAGPALFPRLTMRFHGVVTYWSPRAYLFQRGTSSIWCRAYASNGHVQTTVLGASWMLGKEVIFDLEKKRFGVVDADCPEYRRSPKAPAPQASALALGTSTASRQQPPPMSPIAEFSRTPAAGLLFAAMLLIPVARVAHSWYRSRSEPGALDGLE